MSDIKQVKAIFLSYDGYGQSYLEALFLPILAGVKKIAIKFFAIQFNPFNHQQRATDLTAAKKMGIELEFVNYHNSPRTLGTVFDILNGIVKLAFLVRRKKVQIIHARTHIPGIMALGVKILFPKLQIIFDTDGFVPEERADFGLLSRNSFSYKMLKLAESHLVKSAEVVLTRTNEAKKILIEWYGNQISDKIMVIPNGKDENIYHPHSLEEAQKIREVYGVSRETYLIIYVGSIGSHYLPDKMFQLVSLLNENNKNVFFLLLTASNKNLLKEIAKKNGVSENNFAVEKVLPAEIPKYISAADIGLSFRQPTLSMKGVSPIKVCEYLLCGVPVVTNKGVGDIEDMFDQKLEIGFILDNFGDDELKKAVIWISDYIENKKKIVKENSRQVGVNHFALSKIQEKYESVYKQLIER